MGEPKMPTLGQNPEEMPGIDKEKYINEAIELDKLLSKKEEELSKMQTEVLNMQGELEHLLEFLDEDDTITPEAGHFHLQEDLAKDLGIDIQATKEKFGSVPYDIVIEKLHESEKYKRIFHGHGAKFIGDRWVKIEK